MKAPRYELDEAMRVQAFHDLPNDEAEEESGGSLAASLANLIVVTSRHIALLTAWIAMGGSLFLSDVIGWPPCVLCWYQRILMYPLTLIVATGIWRRDPGVHIYVLPFSIVGAATSLYHYVLIKTDWFPPPPCSSDVPCTVDYLNWFGFINIPFLALTAFLIITCAMMGWGLLHDTEPDDGLALANECDVPVRRSPALDGPRLAVVMISVGVILAFMVASTFV